MPAATPSLLNWQLITDNFSTRTHFLMDLRIGTSGWSYPTGQGTWNGLFYPSPRPRGFDELAFYAERFNTVEVNSTFYGIPTAQTARRWVERTPLTFEFSVKLFQKFTHPVMFRDAVRKQTPQADTGSLDTLSVLTQGDVDLFKAGIDPIWDAGRAGALLAQFPPSFTATPGAVDYLAWLLRTFGSYRVAVELRHRSWSDRFDDTAQLLTAYDAAWVQIDEPKFRFSIRQDQLPHVATFHYMRLHGRNAAQWWRHDAAEDRYNYCYTEEELRPFAETARTARPLVKKLYVYLNNHFAAQSVVNAAQLRRELGDPVLAPMPAELVERYPVLKTPTP
jgi:uncharacterized protein YecE (DUF72 family)